jgi:hypothetical protein
MKIMETRGCIFRDIRQFAQWLENEAFDLLAECGLEEEEGYADTPARRRHHQQQQEQQRTSNVIKALYSSRQMEREKNDMLLSAPSRPGLFVEGGGEKAILVQASQGGAKVDEAKNESPMLLKERLSLVLVDTAPHGQSLRVFVSKSTAVPYTEFHRILLQAMHGVAEPSQIAEILLECDPLGEGLVFPGAVLKCLRPGAAKTASNYAGKSSAKKEALPINALGTYAGDDEW